ncbi:MAG: tetratricopeptide repeat protein [Planctomycetota bacterium]
MAVAVALFAGSLSAKEDDLADWVNEGHWPRSSTSVEITPEKQAAKAKRMQNIGDFKQAAEQYKRLANVYSESGLEEEGLVLSARNYLAAGDYTKCRDQLNELRRRYANPTYLDATGEVEIALARGYLEGKGEGGTYLFKSRIRKARAIFQRQLDQDPEGRWADNALFGLAQCDQAVREYDGAIKKYKDLLEKYPRSELRAETEGNIAICINKREPLPEYTGQDEELILKEIERAKLDASEGDDVDVDIGLLEEHQKVLTDRQARKRYEQALFYIKNRHFRAAEVYLELIKDRYPNSLWAEKSKVELEAIRKR